MILTKDEQVSYRYDTPASTFTSVFLRHSSFVWPMTSFMVSVTTGE